MFIILLGSVCLNSVILANGDATKGSVEKKPDGVIIDVKITLTVDRKKAAEAEMTVADVLRLFQNL